LVFDLRQNRRWRDSFRHPGISGNEWRGAAVSFYQDRIFSGHRAERNNFSSGNLCQILQSCDPEKTLMKRISLLAIAAIAAALAVATPASARLGIAPAAAAQDDAVIQVKGHGHGRGHMGRGGRGHHYGWGRGHGHRHGHHH
jgi:hypothetical protein